MGKTTPKNPPKIQRRTRKRKKEEKKKVYYELDMRMFTEKIKKEMNIISFNNKKNVKKLDEDSYEKLYQEYLLTQFNQNCILFINRIISESKTLSSDIQSSNELHKILMNVVKKIMLNEFELTLFSIILDNLNLVNDNKYSIDIILFLIGLQVKELTSDDFSIILEKIKLEMQEINLKDIYINWKRNIEEKINIISLKLINLKFKTLKKPFSSYCKNNYIDYNNIVDKILKMSLPYNNEGKILEEEDDFLLNDKNESVQKFEEKKNENMKINLNDYSLNKKINNSKNEINNAQKIPISFKINKKENKEKKVIKQTQKDKNNLNKIKKKYDKLSFSVTTNTNNQNVNIHQNLFNSNKINPYFQNLIVNSKNTIENAKNSVLMPNNNPSQSSFNNIQQNQNNIKFDYNYDNLRKNSFQNFDLENDGLRNLLNKSNDNFFQSINSFNSLNNDLELFNNDMVNLNENLQINSKQNSKFSLDGGKCKFNVNNSFNLNDKENNSKDEGKKNFLYIYNKLKENQNKD